MPKIKELVAQLGADQESAFKANHTLLQMVTRASAPGQDADRKKIAKALAAGLTAMTEPSKDDRGRDVPPRPVYNAEARSRVCRLLAYIADASVVPALAQALGDLDVREAARMALDRCTAEDATDALIEAFGQMGPCFRAGIVAALAYRTPAKVLPTLREATNDVDKKVRRAAIYALAQIPDADNDTWLAKACADDNPCGTKKAARKARVRLAYNLKDAGQSAAAERIFKEVVAGKAPAAQTNAALIGLGA